MKYVVLSLQIYWWNGATSIYRRLIYRQWMSPSSRWCTPFTWNTWQRTCQCVLTLRYGNFYVFFLFFIIFFYYNEWRLQWFPYYKCFLYTIMSGDYSDFCITSTLHTMYNAGSLQWFWYCKYFIYGIPLESPILFLMVITPITIQIPCTKEPLREEMNVLTTCTKLCEPCMLIAF